jgi:hypothetical protein
VYPTEFAGSTQNLKKKTCWNIKSNFKCKGANNSCGGYQTKFAPGATIGLKLSSENLNLKREVSRLEGKKDGGQTDGNHVLVVFYL